MSATTSTAMRVVLALCVSAASGSQDRSTYPTNQNPAAFDIDWIAFYDRIDAWTAETRDELDVHLDLSYGSDPKQRLDLYLPQIPAGPVFLFIHGGGFVEGDRAHYGYVARALAESGIITAVMSYRLSPHHYPDQMEDTRLAVTWLHRNVARYGGAPKRLYLGGHSAGAILSAFVAVSRGWMSERGLPSDAIAGVVPVSGPYDLREFGSFVDVYLPEPAEREAASPALNIEGTPPPMVVAFGSKESVFREPSTTFVDKLRAAGGDAQLLELQEANHDDTAASFWRSDSELVRAVKALIARSERE